MMKTGGMFLSMILILLSGLPCLAAPAASAETTALGEIVYRDAERTDLDEASARRVEDGDVVKCLSRGAIVRMGEGQVLKFDSNTAAVFRKDASGRVVLRVLSGRVSMIGENHRWHTAGAGSVFAVHPTQVDPVEAEALLLGEDRAGSDRIRRRSDRHAR